MKDRKRRSIVKTITWRIIAILVTTVSIYIITKDVSISLEAGLIINFIKGALYYFHERF